MLYVIEPTRIAVSRSYDFLLLPNTLIDVRLKHLNKFAKIIVQNIAGDYQPGYLHSNAKNSYNQFPITLNYITIAHS